MYIQGTNSATTLTIAYIHVYTGEQRVSPHYFPPCIYTCIYRGENTHVYTGCEGEKIVYPTLFVPCITQGSKQVTSSSPVYTQGKNSVVILFAPLYVYIYRQWLVWSHYLVPCIYIYRQWLVWSHYLLPCIYIYRQWLVWSHYLSPIYIYRQWLAWSHYLSPIYTYTGSG